jgi:outer membrane protein assembly factor BamB
MRYPLVASLLLAASAMAVAGSPKPVEVPDLRTRTSGEDWPTFLGPRGDSTSLEKGITSPWPESGLPIVWYKKAGIGYAMPAISKGRLFQFDRHGDTARLTCMKSETGEELWRFEYPTNYKDKYSYNGGPRCAPVVDNDRVYLHGVEGMLYCVRVTDGKELWKIDTVSRFNIIQNFFGVGSTPVIEGDLLIVHIGGSPKNADKDDFSNLKGNGSGVVAFNKYTGKIVYSITDELASYSCPQLATIDGRRWCFVLARGGLIAFNPADGKVDFHFPWRAEDFESVNASQPVVIGDKVLITETYGPGAALLQVKPGGYKVLWSDQDKNRDKSLQCHWNTPIVKGGYIYACSGRHTENARLRCVKLDTGEVMWDIPRLTRTSLLHVDGHFVCLSEDGPMILFKENPKKFEPVSVLYLKHPKEKDTELLNYPCWAAPILSNGLMYARGQDYLVCLELIPQKKAHKKE